MCKKGIELKIRINQAEQELTAAQNNYRNTGLARYKQTVTDFEVEFCRATLELARHLDICDGCRLLL